MILGSTDIGKVFLGSTEIGKAYLGSSLVYEAGRVTPEPSILPSGYTRLKYISCTGAQYIDCGFTVNQATNYDVTVMPEGAAAWKTILSARTSTSSRRFDLMFGTNTVADTEVYFGYNNASANYTFSAAVTGSKMQLVKNANTLSVYQDGTLVSTLTRTSATFTTTVNLHIGASNTNGTKANYFIGRIYDADFGETAHYIPSIDPNNVVGMYDIINNVFKSSGTSTPFTAGPNY